MLLVKKITTNLIFCARLHLINGQNLHRAVGKIKFINQNQISHLVFAGHVKRPSLAELRPDTQAMKILLKTGAMAR